MRALPRFCLLGACLTFPLVATIPARAQSDTGERTGLGTDHDNAEARRLFREGVKAFEANDPERARSLLMNAWEIRRTYDVASTLAQVNLLLGHNAEAVTYLDFAVRHFAPHEKAENLERAERSLAEAKLKVATVALDTEPGAEVRVDGVRVGQAPLERPLYLEPGEHRIEVTLQGNTALKPTTVEAGKEYSLTLRIGSPTPEGRPATKPAPSRSRSRVALGISAGAGVAALASGVGFLFAANAQADDAKRIRSGLEGTNPCGAGQTAPQVLEQCKSVSNSLDRERTYRIVEYASFGGAALAGALVTYLLWRGDENETRSLSMQATPTSTGISASVGWSAAF